MGGGALLAGPRVSYILKRLLFKLSGSVYMNFGFFRTDWTFELSFIESCPYYKGVRKLSWSGGQFSFFLPETPLLSGTLISLVFNPPSALGAEF